jgi:hypothetical protein
MGLWAIAVAQPIFDLLGPNPEFFIAHHAERADILAVVLLLAGIVPALLALMAWIGGRYVHRAMMAVLAGAVAMQIVKHAGVHTWIPAAAMAAVAGVGTAIAYHRLAVVRTFATILCAAIVAVPAVVLTRSGTTRLLFSAAASYPDVRMKPGAGTPAPVVLVVMDETPIVSLLDAEGKIDPVLYPNLARLARDGMWYRNATTVSDYTPISVPSILSGRYPKPRQTPAYADHPHSLFTLLGATHRLEVVESATSLCPAALCAAQRDTFRDRMTAISGDLWIVYQHVLLTRDLTAKLPQLTDDWAHFGAGTPDDPPAPTARGRRRDKLQAAINFADSISSDDKQPTFYFMHTLLSHSPWLWLPKGQRNATRAPLSADVGWWYTDDDWGVLQYYQRHLLQLGTTDTVIGRIIARLEAAKLYERTMVVVTADHGIAFRANEQRRNFAPDTAGEIMRIPLIIKFPSGSPAAALAPDRRLGDQNISDRNAETIDIAPTVVDVLGMEMSWKADGASLVSPSPKRMTGKRIFFDGARQTRFYPPSGPDPLPALRRKLEIFGDARNFYRIPRPDRFADLVGRPLGELRVAQGGGAVAVEFLRAYQKVNTSADAVPFDVSGKLEGWGSPGQPVYVAVAVNGIVRAVTRTFRNDPRRWLATPPLDAWHDGRNDLEVFVVDADGSGPLLRRTKQKRGSG